MNKKISSLILITILVLVGCNKKRLPNPEITRKCEDATGGIWGKKGDCKKDFTECIPGVCVEGNCENGKGELRFASGGYYIGGFKNSEFEGKGELHFCDGNNYVGDFKESMNHGIGTFTAKGHTYSGEWKNDKQHGKGKATDKVANASYEGDWENGKPISGIVTHPDGKKQKAKFSPNNEIWLWSKQCQPEPEYECN